MNYQTQEELLAAFQDKMGEVLTKKGNDYSEGDCLSNFKHVAKITGTTPERVVLTMIGIKVARLGVLLSTGKEVKNESIEDSILDLANYTFLLQCTIQDKTF